MAMDESGAKIDTLLNHLREFSRYFEFLGFRGFRVQGIGVFASKGVAFERSSICM